MLADLVRGYGIEAVEFFKSINKLRIVDYFRFGDGLDVVDVGVEGVVF